MRLPIILALLVVITLPKDVHALADSVSAQFQTASASVTQFFDRDDEPVLVAALKGHEATAKNQIANLR
ncbi:MAG: hypothetical protein ACO1OG_04365 [Devosia sp.]